MHLPLAQNHTRFAPKKIALLFGQKIVEAKGNSIGLGEICTDPVENF
jgi:hypothetical protein